MFVLSNGSSVLSNDLFVLSNDSSVLSNDLFVLSNGSSVLSNNFFVLSNNPSVLTNDFFVLSNDLSVLSNGSFVLPNDSFLWTYRLQTYFYCLFVITCIPKKLSLFPSYQKSGLQSMTPTYPLFSIYATIRTDQEHSFL
ncbi:hypothetical protein Barb6_03418 [Bacteroidales bacterium Barb6]|nr:hypothetical protein Barb6_03418 [Bacteroidales bacterium Barb6]